MALSNDVDATGVECVSGTDDGADIKVMFPVLNSDMQSGAREGEVLADCFDGPVAVLVYDVACVTVGEQLRIDAMIQFTRPRLLCRR